MILYCRVSSDEQAENTSLGLQEARLRDYCMRYQRNIIDCYREDYSAKTFKKRPEMNRIMDYCRRHPKQVDEILFLRWDRYSRSLVNALNNIEQLKKLGITVNSIENPLDHNATEFPMMLGIYVGSAEAENNKISRRTKDGIIANRENGVCTNRAPRGYKNVKIDDKHKYVEVVRRDATFIQEIFKQVAKGVETPSYIRRQFLIKGFNISEASFFEMLRNVFYVGKIFVPAYNNTPAHCVKGLHEAIIDEDTFYKVQDVIDGKKKHTPKLTRKIHPDAFLRGYLKCPVCGSSMTGAPSRGNGGTYYYYNCCKDGKHFRYRADEAINKFVNFTAGLKPNKEVLNLYGEILCDLKKESNSEKRIQADNLNTKLSEVNTRLQKLEDMFVDGEITKETFKNMQERYYKEISNLQGQIELFKNPNRSNIEPKLRYSILLINSIDNYIRDAKVEVKCKLLSSMFPEKITFDGKAYRTNSYNSVLDLIYKQTNELWGHKNENGGNFNNSSASVPLDILFSNQFLQDLDLIWELREWIPNP